ncbi:MAG: ATP-binding protein [Bacteroidales bacterium]
MTIFRNRLLQNIIIALLFFLFAFLYGNLENSKIKLVNIAKTLESKLTSKEKKAEDFFAKIKSNYETNKNFATLNKIIPEDIFKTDGFLFLIYKSDTLMYWSDNAVPFDFLKNKEFSQNKIIKLQNGWFRVKSTTYSDYKIISLILIKNEFTYQNDYLVNKFHKDFKTPSEVVISFDISAQKINDKNGEFLFSISTKNSLKINNNVIYILLLLYLIGFLFFISFLHELYCKITVLDKFPFIKFLLFFIDIIFLRVLLFVFHIPSVLYDSKLFSPYYYASTVYLPSLGDLFINSILFLYVAYLFFVKINSETVFIHLKKLQLRIISALLLFTVILFFYFYVVLFKSIIIDSSIPLILNNILGFTVESIVCCIAIFAISLAFLLFGIQFFRISYKRLNNLKALIISLLIVSLIFILLPFTAFLREGIFYPFSFFCLLFIFIIFEKYNNKFTVFQKVVIFLLFFSFFSTFSFYKYNDLKENGNRKLLVQKLTAENDPIAEFLFKDIKPKIETDTVIARQLKLFYPKDSIINYLRATYFKGYLSKYTEQITLCKDFETLIINPEFVNVNCDKYFYDKITAIGKPTMTENFYTLDYGNGSNSYIALFRFFENHNDSLIRTSLYVELDAKFVAKDLGYPELLIDKKMNINPDLSNYSFARYNKGLLVKHYGNYFYKNILMVHNKKDEFSFVDKDAYNHLFYHVNSTTDFIISTPKIGLLERLAPFSYVFIFFGLLSIIFGAITYRIRYIIPSTFNFKTRLQLSVLTIIVVSFVIIGITTLFYITSLNNEKNAELLTEKTHSVLIEIEHKIGNVQSFTPQKATEISDLLIKLSNVFFTDINLFDTKGNLIASSRPQIFDEGLISRKMNPVAYFQLKNIGKTQFVEKENIGNHEYLSAYMPFRNNDNKLVAYLNLPYFAKQSELKKEISSFLKAYLNIYVFLIAVAVFIALFVSNYITRPLTLIKDKLSNLKLGRRNEKIDWNRNDEIGSLIKEYNSMVDQLVKSADLLAKSEREVAWREMAKQVAHEIKNPLTPMKLSIQHLQRAWNDKVPDWDERLKRFTNTIVEQIDSLSLIASEFSDFAKMPRSDFEKVEIIKALQNAIDLFKDGTENNIVFESTIQESCFVYADKKQLIRVFNNLIKNAIQAIPQTTKAKIQIAVEKRNSCFLIKISDNGVGISSEQQPKIFSPNFTTKSGGMGLGLAMVKSIIEAAGGKIWFQSELDKGTTFFVELMEYKD